MPVYVLAYIHVSAGEPLRDEILKGYNLSFWLIRPKLP